MSTRNDKKQTKSFIKGSIKAGGASSVRTVEWIKKLILKIVKLAFEAFRRVFAKSMVLFRKVWINVGDALMWTAFYTWRALKGAARVALVNLFKLGVRSGLWNDSDDYDDEYGDYYGNDYLNAYEY